MPLQLLNTYGMAIKKAQRLGLCAFLWDALFYWNSLAPFNIVKQFFKL